MSEAAGSVKPGALARLKERGFFAQCTDEAALAELLDRQPVTFYVGVDPTGSSLHAGHLVPLYAMAHLLEFGHQAIVVVGGGTARIGDPSGKIEMRRLVGVEQVAENARSIGSQIDRFLRRGAASAFTAGSEGDGSREKSLPVDLVDNAEWLANLNYIDFLREIGRHFSVNRMLSFETYKMRLETGLSFIEFNYQLLQSYDFLRLFQTRNCQLQIGGDDQWGNIVAGVDLIRRVEGSEARACGLTFPLVTRSDGKKMGKTEKGALFLEPSLISPYDFFQYWRNVADADVRKFLLMYTFLPLAVVDELTREAGAALNAAKERLALEVTALVHGEAEAEAARKAAQALFQSGDAGAAADIPGEDLPLKELSEGIGVLELFVRAGLASSRGEARRLVQQGGAVINDRKIGDVESRVDASWALESSQGEQELLLRAGKKRYFRFRLVS
ncbi:tyrosyl-tRNA synthetase [Alkalispirochaeta americana]|uniref:Tyrosine--tRNA ligase n=1 Tax=Alkalispirochaeta americana TaxID=159291 RepID=A0A1N6W5L1_9SPIO|nr:tyrosine--tRNA ligase [Alkalispirochaeta americana]SIQ85245.1 tyrosyl-tRNA synthetase [Alkalispirochaeta americana]